MFAQHLRSLGGGDRVIVDLAVHLRSHCDVTVVARRLPDPARWRAFGMPELPIEQGDARAFLRATRGVDLSVTIANRVPMPSLARRAILLVQFPFDDLRTMSRRRRWWKRWVLRRYELVTYSDFVAAHLADRWGRRDATVVAPPVRLRHHDPSAKEPLILSVGRFAPSKRHDILLEAFARVEALRPGWRLVVVGAGDPASPEVAALAASAGSATVVADASQEELDDLFRRASIYWHAAGFGRAPDAPHLTEHFGMATVEAMSAGAVPIAYGDGGQVEIVDGVGVTWQTVDELVDATCQLIDDADRRAAAAAAAEARARRYGPEHFYQAFDELLGLG